VVLRQAAAIDPKSAGTLSFLGHARRMQGKAAEAADAYRAALAVDPSDRFVLASLGELFLTQGSLDEAEQLFRKVLAGDAGNSRARRSRRDCGAAADDRAMSRLRASWRGI
jgi:protein O-GlcNAc transferase